MPDIEEFGMLVDDVKDAWNQFLDKSVTHKAFQVLEIISLLCGEFCSIAMILYHYLLDEG